MSDHYYTNQPNAEHHFQEFEFPLRGRRLRFVTDSGVFSKNVVDYGSQVLIATYQPPQNPTGTLLDVGCGYGPVGLSFASTFPQVEMIDVNERAVGLAQGNAQRNNIENVDIHVSNIYADVHSNSYEAILSNPPVRAGKKVVQEILTGAYPLLQVGGTLTIVLQKKQGAPSAEKLMTATFGNVEILKRDKGYYILQSVKV